MNGSRLDNFKRFCMPLCDALLALWLITEVLFAHTALSSACLLAFVVAACANALIDKKLYFSWWMAAYALLILWGAAVSLLVASDRATSLSMVKTLIVNAAFLFGLYQYLMQGGDLRRFMRAFVGAVGAIAVYLLIRQTQIGFLTIRLGETAGVNANWIGMLSAFAASMCLVLAKRGRAWWLLLILVFALSILLSQSIKALALASLLLIGTWLVLYPRGWYWKLPAALIVGAVAFYFIIVRDNILSNGILHRLHAMVYFVFDGTIGHADSLVERGSLWQIAISAFRLRPIAGYGLNCYQYLAGANGTYSHCNYTELAVSGGVVLFLIWYLPQLLAAERAFVAVRAAKKTGRDALMVRVFVLYLLLQIVMDAGMVSYADRTAVIFLVLLCAALRLQAGNAAEGTRFCAVLQNPDILFVKLAQKGFFRSMDDEAYLRRFYHGRLGKTLRLDPPVSMNEKLQYLKLHDRDPLHTRLADKAAVREYVSERAGESVLIPLLGVWDEPDAIDLAKLPERFVLKCTHDSGGVFLCTDKAAFDFARVKRALKKRLKRNYYRVGREWPYRDVKPRVLAEAFIGGEDGARPDDYKFFCFHGIAKAIVVCTNRVGSHANYYFFTREFQPLPVNRDTAALVAAGETQEKPAHLDEMIALAERLSQGLTHVRVDLYDTAQGVRFGELTFFDQSGFADDYVEDGDEVIGAFLRLEDEKA